MCGRIQQSRYDKLREWMQREEIPLFDELSEKLTWRPKFNLAPTNSLLAVRRSETGDNEACFLKWGFVPSWTADLGKGLAPINARSENVAKNGMFRGSFARRRCVVPIDGFYEWKRSGKIKQPFRIFAADDNAFPLAAVWDRWEREGKTLETVAVVTTNANELVGKIHDRMRVILDEVDIETWISGDVKKATKLMKPFDEKRMRMYPVSTYVNKAGNEGEQCVEEIKLEETDDAP